jgi:hypothetical protein
MAIEAGQPQPLPGSARNMLRSRGAGTVESSSIGPEKSPRRLSGSIRRTAGNGPGRTGSPRPDGARYASADPHCRRL